MKKVVLITGAGTGIGAATARLLVERGACVMVSDVTAEHAEPLTRELGETAAFHRCDLSCEEQVESMVAATVERFGRIDAAFNNAGIKPPQHQVAEMTTEQWDTTFAVNLRGMFLAMRSEIRAMAAAGGGAIVNTSSGSGVIGSPCAADYIASKHGVVGLTRAASTEFEYSGVRVNAVLPGFIETPMTARLVDEPTYAVRLEDVRKRHSVGRFGQPRDVAEAVCWLLSDRSAFVNGACLAVDGGYTAR